MPSVGPLSAGLKNSSANPYFLVVSTISTLYTYNAPPGSGGSANVSNSALTHYRYVDDLNASVTPGTATTSAGFTSSLLATGNMLRDMGKTVVASGSTFRKVQLMYSSMNAVSGNNTSVTGVQGQRTGYLTGYILLASDSNQTGFDLNVARVVRLY